jgi:hydrogenase nickel incorporation protein HypA/HybF
VHELSLARALLTQLVAESERHAFARVVRVKLAIGALGHVDPEALTFAFEVASRGTLAEGAALDVERVAGAAHCLGCGADVAVHGRGDFCPKCGGGHLVVTGGEDMKIRELEVA